MQQTNALHFIGPMSRLPMVKIFRNVFCAHSGSKYKNGHFSSYMNVPSCLFVRIFILLILTFELQFKKKNCVSSNCWSPTNETAWRWETYIISFLPRPSVRSSVYSPVHPPVHSSVCPSQKTLTWLISSEVLMIEHWYLACMILVTNPFNLHHAVTLSRSKLLLGGGPQLSEFTRLLLLRVSRYIHESLHIDSEWMAVYH